MTQENKTLTFDEALEAVKTKLGEPHALTISNHLEKIKEKDVAVLGQDEVFKLKDSQTGEIVAFHDHLGAGEDVDFLVAETLQDVLEGCASPGGILVEPFDGCLWKSEGQFLLYLLGSHSPKEEFLPRALGTQRGSGL